MSTILKTLRKKHATRGKEDKTQFGNIRTRQEMPRPQPVPTSYTFKDVHIPEDFLIGPAPDSKPMTVESIDFSKTVVPEYAGCYAAVIENVLSASECLELQKLAEQSVVDPIALDNNGTDFWKPAMVNAGPGYEIMVPEYRNSDRIIWDNEVITERLLNRCFLAEGIKEQLSTIEGNVELQGEYFVGKGEKWNATRLNKRMRFLRYGPGQFFKPHCDGRYEDPVTQERTQYTFHFYLNDSKKTAPNPDDVELMGGATSFLSKDETRKLDVDPKAGRVLIFQHRRLYHAGDDVTAGIKYTMRTDLLFKLVKDDEESAKQ